MDNFFDRFDQATQQKPNPAASPRREASVGGGNFFDQFDNSAAASQTLGDPPLRHADGRLTEAGWQAEREAIDAARKQEIEDTGFWHNFVAGYGRSLPNLYQGAKQAYVDSVAGISGTAADVLGDLGGQTLGDARRGAAPTSRTCPANCAKRPTKSVGTVKH